MKLPLSQRLLTCCTFVHPGDRVADVGCDHGYLGIHLLQTGVASSVIASDVNEKPLQGAVINAARYGVKEKMSFFLSNGVQNIPRDFDCMVCAGMGADTMISIFRSAPWLKDPRYRLILQCQSKRPELRRYLAENGFVISRETLAQDGKFIYTVMEVTYAPGTDIPVWNYYITQQLIDGRSPLFPAFLRRVIGGLEERRKGLEHMGAEPDAELTQVLEHLHALEEAQA